MATIDMFIDFHAVIAIALIMGVLFALFRREAMSPDGIDRITGFSFYLSLSVSIVWFAYTLSRISGTTELGKPLSFCLFLLLYATIVRLAAFLVIRFRKGNKEK